MAEDNRPPSDDWDGSASWQDPAVDQPAVPKRRRLLNNRATRFVSSRVPLSMVPSDLGQGALAMAAVEFGWDVTDRDQDADALLDGIPGRVHGYRAGHVVSGRFDPFIDRTAAGLPAGEWRFLAFDVVEDSRLGRTVRACVTAVPSLMALPELRISPTRFPLGRNRGMVVYPTIDQAFDARFRLMAHHGDEQLAALGALVDDDVRSALCADGDTEEVWTASGWILVTTSVAHSEAVLTKHLSILGAMLRALRRSASQA